MQACDKFIYTEVLRAEVETPEPSVARGASPLNVPATPPKPAKGAKTPPKPAAPTSTNAAPESPKKPATLPLPLALLRRAIEEASDEQGWAHLASIGSYLTKIRPDFDPRLYGHKKLSDLLKRHTRYFAIEERGAGHGKALYARALE